MHSIVEEFELAWASGKRPQLKSFLSRVNQNRQQSLLEMLLVVEIHYRIDAGEHFIANDYREFGASAIRQVEELQQDQNDTFASQTASTGQSLDSITPEDSSENTSTNVTRDMPSEDYKKSKTIGPYKLLQILGEGGMGTVWMAEQVRPVRRRVALKLIKEGVDNKQVVARFEAERQALAMMSHNNIARVLDAGTSETGQPYFVMELVQGIPLTKYCDKNKLTIRERLELFIPVCLAVNHAHLKGIIHRDLKPSNVLACLYDGLPVPKVIDFGLAKALQHQPKLTDKTMFTEFGQVVGTLKYMSPEQAELNQWDVDTRTDIYSLGVMLYELLSGSTPIGQDVINETAILKVLEKIRETDPPRPSTRISSFTNEAVSGISSKRKIQPSRLKNALMGDLDWIVMKALEKDRTRRYETANAFAEDVTRYLNGEAIEARPPSTRYRVGKFVRKHRGLVATLLSIAALLVAGITGTSWFAFKANASRKVSEQRTLEVTAEKERADKETENARAAEKTSRENERLADEEAGRARKAEATAKQKQLEAVETLARSNYFLAIARWESNRVDEALEYLEKVPLEYRKIEWHLARRQFPGSDVTCYGHQNFIAQTAFSPDGKMVASGSSDHSVRLWDAITATEIKVFREHTESVVGIAFSPDGKLLASASGDKTVKIWNIESGQSIQTFQHPGGLKSVAFSADGKTVAAGSYKDNVRLWDVESGKNIKALDGSFTYVVSIAFSPNGKSLATASWDKSVKVVDIESGKVTHSFEFPEIATFVAFSPDGKRLVASTASRQFKLWDIENESQMQVFSGHKDEIFSVTFSPDGTRIASSSRDTTIKIWDAASGTELISLRGHRDAVRSVSFSPDGKRLVSGGLDNLVKIWDATTGLENQTFLSQAERLNNCAFSPDGKWLATAAGGFEQFVDNSIVIWDVKTGQIAKRLQGHELGVRTIAFNRDGSRLASAGYDKTIRIWDTRSGHSLHTLSGHSSPVHDVEFAPDGSQLASVGSDSTIRFWDAVSGDELRSYKIHHGSIWGISFNSDGSQFAIACDDQTIKLIDSYSGEVIKTFKGHFGDANYVIFSAKDKLLVSTSDDRTIRFWDIPTGRQLRTLRGHTSQVNEIIFNENEQRLVSTGGDASVRIWDVENGEELRNLIGHANYVSSLSILNGTNIFATVGHEGKAVFWDATRDPEIRVFRGHTEFVDGVSFSKNGKQVHSESATERITWDFSTGAIVSKEYTVEADWSELNPRRNISPDGQFLVASSKDDIFIVDLDFRNSDYQSGYRQQKAAFNPVWHEKRALVAEKNRDWFAAAVNRAWQLKEDPNSIVAFVGVRFAIEKLKKSSSTGSSIPLPSVVAEVLKMPPAIDSSNNSDAFCDWVWGRHLKPGNIPTDLQIEVLEFHCQRSQSRKRLNALGLAYFRLGDFNTALETCKKSMDLRKDSDPIRFTLSDLTVLAICHFQLGNNRQSNLFRKSLTAELKKAEKSDADSALWFNREQEQFFKDKLTLDDAK